jgi:cystathionine beta-lyase/cystathionine gamma-synthase
VSDLGRWLDPSGCPRERPAYAAMSTATRRLHDAVDANARAAGVPYLHPSSPTIQLDMLGSPNVVAWQEGKSAFLFLGEGCWSELPHLYGRYGTGAGRALLDAVRELEGAKAAVLADSGMQATALVFDVLVGPGAHAVSMRQVYNKTRTYLEWLCKRVGGSFTIVDDGDLDALATAITPATTLVFAETFTNPLVRAQDPERLGAVVQEARKRAPGVVLCIDDTIATPWAFRRPLLDYPGVSVVVASGTKALGGQDTDLWGYVATRDVDLANQVMDLVAMRGGILDWRRAAAVHAGLPAAAEAHARRCASARRIAAFLASHPRVSDVFHPSLPDHPDAATVAAHYVRHGSMVSFRARGADEAATRHLADVLATTTIVRYALSFDGPTTKVNHHKTVSEYFTPDDALARNGFDRLVRLGVGTEDADDLVACLNWALHHAGAVGPDELAAWQAERRAALEVRTPGG